MYEKTLVARKVFVDGIMYISPNEDIPLTVYLGS